MASIGAQQGGPIEAPTIATIDLATEADTPVVASLLLTGIKGNERNGLAWAIENNISWGYVSGVAPQELLIQMHRDEVGLLTRINKRPVVTELEMTQKGEVAGIDQTVKRKFRNLRVLSDEDATLESKIVKITDDRYRWKRAKVWLQVNITRRVNNQIVKLGAGRRTLLRENSELYRSNTVTTEARQILAQVAARKSTPSKDLPTDSPDPRPLQPINAADIPKAYTALDVVVEVLERYLGYKAGADGNIIIQSRNTSEYIPQDIKLQGEPADTVIQRFLAMDGNDLYIDDNGNIVIQDALIALTTAQYKRKIGGRDAFFPESLAGRLGDSNLIDIRPSLIVTQTVPEKEILFSFVSAGAQSSVVGRPATTREEAIKQINNGQVFLENVTRTVIDGQVRDADGSLRAKGTIISIEEGFASLNSFFGVAGLSIDEYTAKYGPTIMAQKTILGGASFKQDQVDMVTRALQTDFRTFFRIPQVVVDELLSIKTVLANILNNRTRTREPATVFSRITRTDANVLMLNKVERQAGILDSFFEYPNGVRAGAKARSTFLPISFAQVSVVDFDLGLIRVQFGNDDQLPGAVEGFLPGVANDKSYYAKNANSLLSIQAADVNGARAGLEPDWECSVVMSCVPFVENSPNRLFEENFDIQSLSGITGLNGKGPRIFIPIRADTARFHVQDVRYLSGPEFKQSSNPTAARIGAAGGYVNSEVISANGEMEARRIFRTYQDVIVGFETFGLNDVTKKCVPLGAVRNVIFTHAASGLQTCDLVAARVTTPEDITSLLPEEYLQVLAGQLDASVLNPQGSN